VGEKQFRNEVRTIGRIQHVNLVRLRGFSSHGSERLLVYDYMPNGSLDRALFWGAAAPPTLSWSARFQIALGAARGLLYLHEGCRDCIIHCYMKPENILLDEDLVPKVADFGMAKLVGRDFSRVLTTVRGTIGYLAPEWISGVPITAKADVYSYGMVLLEIISGRRNARCWVTTEHGALLSEYFPLVAARNVSEGAALVALLDERLQGDADPRELGRPPRRIARRRRPSRLPRSRRATCQNCSPAWRKRPAQWSKRGNGGRAVVTKARLRGLRRLGVFLSTAGVGSIFMRKIDVRG